MAHMLRTLASLSEDLDSYLKTYMVAKNIL